MARPVLLPVLLLATFAAGCAWMTPKENPDPLLRRRGGSCCNPFAADNLDPIQRPCPPSPPADVSAEPKSR